MIKFENVQVTGWEAALRGMRNPLNSWDKADSHRGLSGDEWTYDPGYIIGEKDHELAMKLSRGGSCHAKYRRMMVVYVDITAPLYWWKEFDTYRFGCEKNSCSTMHKIHEKEFTEDDFSIEHLELFLWTDKTGGQHQFDIKRHFVQTIKALNWAREKYIETSDKRYWWQMIQLLPSSYNQKRTVMMSYELLANIYHNGRRNHRLDEWREFCQWSEGLPYSEFFTLEGGTSRD